MLPRQAAETPPIHWHILQTRSKLVRIQSLQWIAYAGPYICLHKIYTFCFEREKGNDLCKKCKKEVEGRVVCPPSVAVFLPDSTT